MLLALLTEKCLIDFLSFLTLQATASKCTINHDESEDKDS